MSNDTNKYSSIKDIEQKYSLTIYENFKQLILDVFNEKIIVNENNLLQFENLDNYSDYLVSFGLYEENVNEQNIKALMYYLKASDLNNDFGIYRFASYNERTDAFHTAEVFFLKLQNSKFINYNYFLGCLNHNKSLLEEMTDDETKSLSLKAISYYTKSFEKCNIKYSSALLGIADCYENIKEYDNAIIFYKLALEHHEYDALINLSEIYSVLQMYDDAKLIYADVIKHNKIKAKIILDRMIDITVRYKILLDYELLQQESTNNSLLQQTTNNSLLQQTTNNPLLQQTTNNPLLQQITNNSSLQQESANNLLLQQETTNNLLLQQESTNNLLLQQTTNNPSLQQTTNNPSLQQESTNNSLLQQITNNSSLQQITNNSSLQQESINNLLSLRQITNNPSLQQEQKQIYNNHIKDELTILRNNNTINNFINNISFSKKHKLMEDCPICYKNDIPIFYSCFHSCCVDCYNKTVNCPICRNKKI